MAVPHNLPRRRPASPSIDNLTDSMKTVSLAKGSTFQVPPTQDTEVLDPFLRGLSIPGLPCRSATCPKSLEDLLIGAGERRAVELLKRVDEAIAKNAELSNILSEPEVLPVPRFMVEHAQVPDSKPPTLSRQDSQQDKDSGIGSSIVSTEEKMKHMSANNNTTRSAVNRSIAGSDDTEKAHQLSEYAQKQIHRHIIEPILKEEKLKEFHPLIKDVPNKIGNKDIRSLRDLEKTLIFLAPDYSESPTAYRSFCETSIRCLHLAVNSVHETDRCSPTDRPYTTNYFIDLVEQIRRYASILAATRAKQAQGEELDEMDATSSDEIELQGGVSHNGKPAVLTRRRGSKVINMATNQVMSEEDVAAASAKRHMEDDLTDDDGVRRSMARRKKNEPIRTYYCKQDGCSKQFKRPCDLTKHIKTHERPWKCPDETCKYHEVGWPTEKERERHVNDKHSDSPVMYKCLEPGCPYTSKRESNCKQHMEKAHDIPYVRSKNNGKGKAVQHLSKVSPSVKTDSAIGTPFTPPAPSPSVHSSASGDSVMAGPSNYIPESNFDFSDFMPSHFNTDYLNPASSIPFTPSWTNDRRTSVGTGTSVTNYSPFDPPSHDFGESLMKTEQYDFTMFDAYQQPTPDSINNMSLFPDNSMPQINANADLTAFSPHVSPGAQDMTFGTHFNDAMAIDNFATEDFSLYGNTAMAQNTFPQNMGTNDNFGGLDNMGGQFSATQSDSQHDILSLFPELKNQN